MNTHTLRWLSAVAAGAVVTLAGATMMTSASSPRFYDDDPIWVERATQDASGMKPQEVNLFVDLTSNLLSGGTVLDPVRAENINTVEEVPDSAWFTNRAGRRTLTSQDITTGPNSSNGPAAGAWTVTSSKSDGVTPGFTIKDAKGQRWFLKFDPPGYRAMATGTEVAVTKLMWALGYNVPENHVAYLQRNQLVLGADAKFSLPGGKSRAMRQTDIDDLLARADREPNGSYRIVASKALAGKPIGRIRFVGSRPDDPNDIVAHENRRELRGYGVFAAWLNHVDAKAINSLDTLVAEDGRSYVRHHLIDFGSSLGSGGVGPADYWAGEGYLFEPRDIGKRIIAFGTRPAKWQTASFYEAKAIGRFPEHNAQFDPDRWKPRVPNQAFLNARDDDKFWAARKLMSLNIDLLRAAVRTGEFGDPDAEAFLVRALLERRNAIGRKYLTAVNPIVDPVLHNDGTLTFGNAAVDADVARAPVGYDAVWSRFDNATGTTEFIAETTSRSNTMDVPEGLPRTDGAFIEVQLAAIGAEHASWSEPVTAVFRLRQGSWKLVGLERLTQSAE